MKKIFVVKAIFISILMVFMVAPVAMANQVTFTGGSGYGPYQTGLGGEFTLLPDAGLSWVLSSYVPGVTSGFVQTGTFQTFCVEKSEYIYANTTFDASISDHSIYTNVVLTKGAAWLYDQFQIGQLAGYDYTRIPTPVNETQQLQDAIWYFMGVGPNTGNTFIALGLAHGGLAANDNEFPVAVLNLWADGHLGESAYRRQDQLVCTPVPEPATMLLLGSGLLGLAGFARRKFKK